MSTPAISAGVSAYSQADTGPADQAFNQLAKTSSHRLQRTEVTPFIGPGAIQSESLFRNVKMSRGDVNSAEYAHTRNMSYFKR